MAILVFISFPFALVFTDTKSERLRRRASQWLLEYSLLIKNNYAPFFLSNNRPSSFILAAVIAGESWLKTGTH
ncbi:hypothetical protein DL96DRAFT_1628129 [Flagelloscypha sp. PMI_526]|nr:hypothetical protein DL96DRAFT_1628129 [Flagelloscypha sp. PMI_526]